MSISSSPIQSIPSNTYTSGTTITFSITAPSNGNFQAVTLHVSSGASTVSSISQTGCSWVKAAASDVNRDAEIWYAENVSGGGTTVTVTFSSSSGLAGIIGWYSEWSGVATSSSLDVTGTNNSSSTTPQSSIVTPTAGLNELMIVCATAHGGFTISSGPTNSFTGVQPSGMNVPNLQAYFVETSTSGGYSTSWTMNSSGTWDAVIATFKAAGGGATFKNFYRDDSSSFYSGQV